MFSHLLQYLLEHLQAAAADVAEHPAADLAAAAADHRKVIKNIVEFKDCFVSKQSFLYFGFLTQI